MAACHPAMTDAEAMVHHDPGVVDVAALAPFRDAYNDDDDRPVRHC